MANIEQAIQWNSVGRIVRRRINRWKFWKKEYRYLDGSKLTNDDILATDWHSNVSAIRSDIYEHHSIDLEELG